MTEATVTVVGSYPKPPHEGGDFHLRKTLWALDRGDATADDLRRVQDDLVREVLDEQARAGIEIATDGQIRWDDPQTRLADGLEGFTTGGLIRYLDTNTYYRQPVVKGPVGRRGPILVEELVFAIEASPVPVKPTLVGPYTLAALSSDEHYGDVRALVMDLARALNQEARDLVAAGATIVQFDEPILAKVPGTAPGTLEVFAEAASLLTQGVEATTVLQTWFGDVAGHGAALFELPFDGFGLDLVAGPANRDLISALPAGKILSAGIVDARTTKLEDEDDVVASIRELAEAVDPERLWVSPSAGLEYLPREAAERKCTRLADAARKFREVG